MSELAANLPVQLRTIEYRSTGLAIRCEVLVARLERLVQALNAQGSASMVSLANMLDVPRRNLALGQEAFDQVSRDLAALDASITPLNGF